MPTLFHLSDLHFGPHFNEHLADLLLHDLQTAHPNLIIVSGDWTMRGRISEYEQARDYLLRLPGPVLTIPGNHDQPLHPAGLVDRLVRPWGRYRRFIHPETDTVFQSDGLFVLGLNDNHNVIPGGIWSRSQRRWMESTLHGAPPNACKVLVMHHHLLWDGQWRPAGQWFPTRTLNRLAGLGVELILNGHTHIPATRQMPQGIIIAQAGTTMSGRTRQGQGNTFNRIEIGPDRIEVTLYGFEASEDRFQEKNRATFVRMNRGAT